MYGLMKSSLVKVKEESKVNLKCLHMFLTGDAKIQIWRLLTHIL